MLLNMFECTTGLYKALVGAEGTNTLVYGGDMGAESLEHFSWDGDALVCPFLALYYCIEGTEELHIDRFVELP